MDSQGSTKSGVSIKRIIVWASIIVAGIIILVMIFKSLSVKAEKEVETVPKSEVVELRDLRAREIETLTSYKMIDEQNGIVQIPVERAMQLIADKAFRNQLKKAR